jgi:hypothetical protein
MASVSATADRGAWLRLLARWGLLTSLAVAGLMTTFFSAMAMVSSQPGIGGDHDELLMAAYAPGLYRIAMVFDALGWLFMGGLIVIAGLALRREASVRGPLAAALGVTAITGITGAFLRLEVVGDLGKQFIAAADTAKPTILSLYRSVDLIIGADFTAGQLTVGLGFLVVGTAALGVGWVPRTISWLLLLPGVTSLALLVGEVVLDVFLFPLLLLHVVLLAVAGVALAYTWWHAPSPTVEAATVKPAPA